MGGSLFSVRRSYFAGRALFVRADAPASGCFRCSRFSGDGRLPTGSTSPQGVRICAAPAEAPAESADAPANSGFSGDRRTPPACACAAKSSMTRTTEYTKTPSRTFFPINSPSFQIQLHTHKAYTLFDRQGMKKAASGKVYPETARGAKQKTSFYSPFFSETMKKRSVRTAAPPMTYQWFIPSACGMVIFP